MNDLNRVEKLIAEATPGPWFNDYGTIGVGENGIGEMDETQDAELCVHARQLLPLMLAEITAWRKFDRQWDDPDSRSDDLVDLEHAAYLLQMETDTYITECLEER